MSGEYQTGQCFEPRNFLKQLQELSADISVGNEPSLCGLDIADAGYLLAEEDRLEEPDAIFDMPVGKLAEEMAEMFPDEANPSTLSA